MKDIIEFIDLYMYKEKSSIVKADNIKNFIKMLTIFILQNKDLEANDKGVIFFNYDKYGLSVLNYLGKILTSIHYILKYKKCEFIPNEIKDQIIIKLNLSNKEIINYIKDNFDIKTIITKYRGEKSYNGFSLDILKSALQKYIRRGNLDKAIYFAIETCLFIFTEQDTNQKRIITNFIHRLQIIFLEDVGLGCYNDWEMIDNLFDILFKRDKNSFIFSFINIVATMTLNKHIRICSHYNSLRTVIKTDKNLKKIKKYIDYFPGFKKYSKLIQQNTDDNIYSTYKNSVKYNQMDAGYWVRELENDDKLTSGMINDIFLPLKDVKYSTISKKWTKELNGVKERFLPYYSTILYKYFKFTDRDCKLFEINNFEIIQYLYINLNNKISLDEYVIDMHTKQGKRTKGVKDFVYEGSKVENELYINDEANEWKDFYNFTKLLFQENEIDRSFLKDYRTKNAETHTEEKGIKETHTEEKGIKETHTEEKDTESSMFNFIVRAQLVTSASKQDTYYASDKKNNIIKFVKGPYLEKSKIEIIENIKNLRKLLNEPYINFEILYLVPDLLESPLSTRNKAIKNKKYPFLVYENVIKEKLKTKIKDSKLWPETEVVDYEKMLKYEFNPSKCGKDIFKQYVIHLLFRSMIGASDLADRNFIIVDNILYSVDEETLKDDLDIESGLRKAKYSLVLEFIKNNKSFLRDKINDWKEKLKSNKKTPLADRALERIETNEFINLVN
jgi:hypothetical protein